MFCESAEDRDHSAESRIHRISSAIPGGGDLERNSDVVTEQSTRMGVDCDFDCDHEFFGDGVEMYLCHHL